MVSTIIFQQKSFTNSKSKNNEEVKRIYQSQIIDINKADFEQLVSLPGIGPSKAKSILEYREKVGEFKSIDELVNVSGIGHATLEKIKDYVKIGNAENKEYKISNNEKQKKKININTATVEELQKLPGIGPVKAQNIVEYRNKYGKFTSTEELLKVNGIGEKTLDKIKPFLSF